jgi:hypothetical protein
MSFIAAAVIGAGAALGGAYLASNAAGDAADTQAAAANRSADLQYKMFQEQQKTQKPFLEAGLKGQNRLMDLLGLSANTGAAGYGSAARNFGMSDFEQDPGYAFRMSEGLKALDRTAASRGGMLSGAALKGATRYGQDMASQEYQNAYNRYQTNRAGILNPLQSLAGQGQTTANTLGAAGQNYATNAGNAYMNAGNAAASGYVGSANAWNSALGGAANSYMQSQMLNRLLPSAGGGGALPTSGLPSYFNSVPAVYNAAPYYSA